jgi:hypothetical protein
MLRVQQQQNRLNASFERTLIDVDTLAADNTISRSAAGALRLAQSRGRLFALFLQLPPDQQRRRWAEVLPRTFGNGDAHPSVIPWQLIGEPSKSAAAADPRNSSSLRLAQFGARLERLQRLERVGRMRVSEGAWAVTLDRERQRVLAAFAALTPAERRRVRGEAELIMGRRLPWDSELLDADRDQAGELELAPPTDSLMPMPPDQKAALQRFARAVAAFRFLDHPLRLHTRAFAVTPLAQQWTARLMQELMDDLRPASFQLHQTAVPHRLAALVDTLAELTAARAFPLPRRLDPRGHDQSRLLEALIARAKHILFVHLGDDEREWLRRLFEQTVAPWPADRD